MPQKTPAMARLERSAAQAREELRRFYGEVGLAAVATALNLELEPETIARAQGEDDHTSAALADQSCAA